MYINKLQNIEEKVEKISIKPLSKTLPKFFQHRKIKKKNKGGRKTPRPLWNVRPLKFFFVQTNIFLPFFYSFSFFPTSTIKVQNCLELNNLGLTFKGNEKRPIRSSSLFSFFSLRRMKLEYSASTGKEEGGCAWCRVFYRKIPWPKERRSAVAYASVSGRARNSFYLPFLFHSTLARVYFSSLLGDVV